MDNFTIASFLHLFMRIVLVGSLVLFVVALGERAFGFSVRKAVDAIESQAENGNVWPVTVLLVSALLLIGYVLG